MEQFRSNESFFHWPATDNLEKFLLHTQKSAQKINLICQNAQILQSKATCAAAAVAVVK
jgi:hypothetical protein